MQLAAQARVITRRRLGRGSVRRLRCRIEDCGRQQSSSWTTNCGGGSFFVSIENSTAAVVVKCPLLGHRAGTDLVEHQSWHVKVQAGTNQPCLPFSTKTPSQRTEARKKLSEQENMLHEPALAQKWVRMLEQIEGYHAIHGHCFIDPCKLQEMQATDDASSTSNSNNLADLKKWMQIQRNLRTRNKLSAAQIRILEHNVQFPWSDSEARWQSLLTELEEFKDKEGHLNVPQNTKLGRRVNNLRYKYTKFLEKGGDSSSVSFTQERLDELDALGFVWDVYEEQWQNQFKDLMKFHHKYGHLNVSTVLNDLMQPVRDDPAHTLLGRELRRFLIVKYRELVLWITRQRVAKIAYDLSHEEVHGKFRASEATKDAKNNAKSRRKGRPRKNDSATSVATSTLPQSLYATTWNMTAGRLRKLEDIGFSWEILHKSNPVMTPSCMDMDDTTWNTRINVLQLCKLQQGDSFFPEDLETNKQLAQWVLELRLEYKRLRHFNKKWIGKSAALSDENYNNAGEDKETRSSWLTEERIDQLNGMGFVWLDDPRQVWDWHYKRLEAYNNQHGHCRYPMGDYSNKLTKWINQHRYFYKCLKDDLLTIELPLVNDVKPYDPLLLDNRLKRLIDIDFVWNLIDHRWNVALNAMVEYKRSHPQAIWPQSDKTTDLGRFLTRVEQLLKRVGEGEGTTKDKEKVEGLQEVGYDVSAIVYWSEESSKKRKGSKRRKADKKR
jgi:hypothetical protein